jgi:hypothetical protein
LPRIEPRTMPCQLVVLNLTTQTVNLVHLQLLFLMLKNKSECCLTSNPGILKYRDLTFVSEFQHRKIIARNSEANSCCVRKGFLFLVSDRVFCFIFLVSDRVSLSQSSCFSKNFRVSHQVLHMVSSAHCEYQTVYPITLC